MVNQKGKFTIQKWKRAELGTQASDVSTAHCAIERTSSTPNLIILRHKVTNHENLIMRTSREIMISQERKFAIQEWKRVKLGIQASTAHRAIERTSSTPHHFISRVVLGKAEIIMLKVWTRS